LPLVARGREAVGPFERGEVFVGTKFAEAGFQFAEEGFYGVWPGNFGGCG
jgi:hypothetical protein